MSFSEEIKNEILNSIEKSTKKLDKIKYESFGEMLTQTNKKNDLKDEYSQFFDISKLNEDEIKFEQIRVEKQVKNNINRTINCETANLSKTIASSVKQLEAIKNLKKCGEYDRLEEKLKYVAQLREKYPDKSLAFIASKTNVENKLTKSGLKHRLDKIIEISNNYKK